MCPEPPKLTHVAHDKYAKGDDNGAKAQRPDNNRRTRKHTQEQAEGPASPSPPVSGKAPRLCVCSNSDNTWCHCRSRAPRAWAHDGRATTPLPRSEGVDHGGMDQIHTPQALPNPSATLCSRNRKLIANARATASRQAVRKRCAAGRAAQWERRRRGAALPAAHCQASAPWSTPTPTASSVSWVSLLGRAMETGSPSLSTTHCYTRHAVHMNVRKEW